MSESKMPKLEVFDKLVEIPLIDVAYNTCIDIYKRIKDSNCITYYTMNGAEGAVGIALCVVTPAAITFQTPIKFVDGTLCKGIELITEKVPIVKEQPAQIYESSINYISNTRIANQVQKIANFGLQIGNALLSTSCGRLALTGLDKTSSFADRCIDYVLSVAEDEENIHPHPNSECSDKILHTVHTVGALTVKVSRRVYYKTLRRSRKNKKCNKSNENIQQTEEIVIEEKSSSPKKDTSPSKKESTSPIKDTSPTKKESSSSKKDTSPSKKDTSPSKKESTSPKKDTLTSSLKKQSSPNKDISPSKKESNSPKKKSDSPNKTDVN